MKRMESSTSRWPLGRWIVLLSVMSAIWGCGAPTGTVVGKVTVNGNPLSAGTVIFHSARGEPTLAWIGEDGTYRVEKVPAGPAKVSVGAFTRQPDGFRLVQNFPDSIGGPITAPPEEWSRSAEQVSSHYSDPESSRLSCDVQRGETRFDIPLVGVSPKKNARTKNADR